MAAPCKRKRDEVAAFVFSSGAPPFAKKDEYVAGSVTFAIVGVALDRGGSFTGGDRWKVTVTRDDTGSTEIVTLPTNEKRDAELRKAEQHIAATGPIGGVRLVKRGNAYYFRSA